MEALKDPGVIVGGVSLVVAGSTAAYCYKQISNINEDLQEVGKSLDELGTAVTSCQNEAAKIKTVVEAIASVRGLVKKVAIRLEDVEYRQEEVFDNIRETQEAIDDIITVLRTKDIVVEEAKPVPPPSRFGRRRGEQEERSSPYGRSAHRETHRPSPRGNHRVADDYAPRHQQQEEMRGGSDTDAELLALINGR